MGLSTNSDGRTRDQQKSRVYAAEGSIRVLRSKKAQRLLVDDARLIPQKGWQAPYTVNGKPVAPDVEACQRYVDDVMREAWVQRRWGQRVLTVHWKAGGSATGSYFGNRLALPPWSRVEAVILHEIAHNLVGSHDCASHGPEFAGLLLSLVRLRMGKAAADRLRTAYKAERVRYNLKAVPAPTKPVVTAADRAAKSKARIGNIASSTLRRQRAARALRLLVVSTAARDPWFGGPATKSRARALATAKVLDPAGTARGLDSTAYVDPERAEDAAEVLRAVVAEGGYGPAGSKPRTYALAVARRLDEVNALRRPDARRTYAATPARW